MRAIKRVEVLASELRITDANSAIMWTGMWDEVMLYLLVTARGGAPTSLDAVVKYTPDGGTTYVAPDTAEAFTQVTGATATQFLKLSNVSEAFRVETTLAGGSAGVGWTFSMVAIMKRLR